MAAAHAHDHSIGSGHPHASGHSHGAGQSAKVILAALIANALLAVFQVAAGVLWGSIALIADSAHQVVDVIGLAIALVGVRLAARGVTSRNTFGWGRADVLGALASATLLVLSSIWITVEAMRRLADPVGIDGVPVLVVAIIGLAVNAGSAVALSRVGTTMSSRAAIVHLIGDAAGSAGVLLSAVAVLTVDATWVDPVVAIAISLWVAFTGLRLMRASGRLLLDIVPDHLSTDDVTATLTALDEVVDAHHVHLWEPTPGEPAVSAHLVVDGDISVHESQSLLDKVRSALLDEHGVGHATFEVECHPCEEAEHGAATVAAEEGE